MNFQIQHEEQVDMVIPVHINPNFCKNYCLLNT
jgi:hypothetical protein